MTPTASGRIPANTIQITRRHHASVPIPNHFANDLNTQGATDLLASTASVSPAGNSRPGLHDSSSGQTVMIARRPRLHRRLLPSAAGVHHQLSPAAFRLMSFTFTPLRTGTGHHPSPATARARAVEPQPGHDLQLLTEFLIPAPQIQTVQLPDGDTDDHLIFGVMQMVRRKPSHRGQRHYALKLKTLDGHQWPGLPDRGNPASQPLFSA